MGGDISLRDVLNEQRRCRLRPELGTTQISRNDTALTRRRFSVLYTFMNAQPHPSSFDHAAGPVPDDVAYHRGMLNELAELGMDMARRVHHAATAPGEAGAGVSDAASAEAFGRAFDRVARCVRRTVLLARRVCEPVSVKPGAERAETLARYGRVSARRQILRAVEDEIDATVHDPDAQAELRAELHERLDGPDVVEDLDVRPVSGIIEHIRRDLGLGPDGKPGVFRRTPEAIAVLCARAAAGDGQGRAGFVAPGGMARAGVERSAEEGRAEAERFFRLLGRP